MTFVHNSGQGRGLFGSAAEDCVVWTGESEMKSVRPVVSTRLNAPGDMEENIVSKMSKLSLSVADIELSRHVLKRGSFMSKRLAVDVGEKVVNGAVEVDDGMVRLNPLDRFWGDWFCVNEASVCAKESRIGDV